MKFGVLVALLVSLLANAAQAEPAVIFDMGGKFDKSFNEAAYLGMERWKKEAGKSYLEFEISNEAQREQAMRRLAEEGGFLVGMLAAMASKSARSGSSAGWIFR